MGYTRLDLPHFNSGLVIIWPPPLTDNTLAQQLVLLADATPVAAAATVATTASPHLYCRLLILHHLFTIYKSQYI